MKKLFLFLFFVLFFCSFAYSAVLSGLDWDNPKFDKITNDSDFILTIKSGETVEATDFTIKKDSSYSKNVFLVFEHDSKLINKTGTALKIDSSITVIMNGAEGSPAVIHARGKNLIIDANLLIKGNSIISSAGEDGNNGLWRGPKDEESQCKNAETNECSNWTLCAMDYGYGHENERAKNGGNAGTLTINNVKVEANVIFSANGGKGGQGIKGYSEHENSSNQEAIGGGKGGNGGNANNIIIKNMTAKNGNISLTAIGGKGGNGGQGGNDIGDQDHKGGSGGNGGNGSKITILNLENTSAKIFVDSFTGKEGLGGKGGGDSYYNCVGKNGVPGSSIGNAFLPFLSGYAPLRITAKNIILKAKLLGDIGFFPETNYSALERIDFVSCRVKGPGMEYSDQELVEMTANTIDFNVWNPLKFFDRILLTTYSNELFANKNFSCNLNPKYSMKIPFEGKIHNIQEGFVKEIKIVNSATGETEFEDLSQRNFFNGFFSSILNANLYSNTSYKIYFEVCNSNGSLCEPFVFDFFTWRRLW